MKDAGINIYRLLNDGEENSSEVLRWSIANNWLRNEAYIYVEKGLNYPGGELQVRWESAEEDKHGFYHFDGQSIHNHFSFATSLFNSLNEGHLLYYMDEEREEQKLFRNPREEKRFERIMRDYLELVNLR